MTNRMKKIDFHTHYLTPGLIKFLGRHFDGLSDGTPTPNWSMEATLEYMDELNIEYAISSHSSPHVNFGDKNETIELAQEINEFGAAMMKMHPSKLGFAATLPLPYVEESIKEIQRSLKVNRAKGITLPTNSLGVYLGDPVLDPIMEELNKEKALVMLHPNEPHTRDKNVNKKLPIPLMEFFFDTSRVVLNMLENGIFTRYPDIRFILPHAGATLPIIADRVDAALSALTNDPVANAMDIKKVMKNVYFDVAGMVLPRQLPMLLQLADPKKILYASDAPYTPAKLVVSLGNQLEYTDLLSEDLKKDIFYNNGIALIKQNKQKVI